MFKRARELYNQGTKTNLIVKKKIDKMRAKVDKIKTEIETSELSLISEVDINKIFSRGIALILIRNPKYTRTKYQSAFAE